MVWAEFEDSLNIKDPLGEFHICLGDLFDKAVVSYDVINRAAQLYLDAARRFPNVTFIIVKGNHDWQRDLDRISAFDLFTSIVQQQENIQVVDLFYRVDNDFAVFAWHPTITSAEMVEKCGGVYQTAYGHWDVEGYGDHNPNLIPLDELWAHGVKTVVTGHIHKPHTFQHGDDMTVQVFGSMQPYAHGEEINDDLYISLTLDEYRTTNLDLTNRCVRIVLNDDETFDEDLNCLQLVIKRHDEQDEMPIETVSLGEFDMMSLFTQAFREAGVSEKVTATMIGKYNEVRLADGI